MLDEAARAQTVRVTLTSNLYAIALMPLIRVVGDLAKLIGYPVGWWWRLTQSPPGLARL